MDRIAALASGADSIRDVIAFPKTASGSDPLTGAPAPVDGAQLKELGIVSTVKPPVIENPTMVEIPRDEGEPATPAVAGGVNPVADEPPKG